MDKRWLLVAGLVIGVFLFVIFLVPFFVNAEAFRPTIESQLSGALGRDVTMGKLSFSFMQGSLTAEDLVIADDPAFSDVPFVQAKMLEVGVALVPFFVHRQVRITDLTIDSPSFQLIKHANGRWNYSSLGAKPAKLASQDQPGSSSDLSVGHFKIVNGSALVSSIPTTAKPFACSDIVLSVSQFSFSNTFPFEFSAKLPSGTLKLTGNAGPISKQDTSQTPFTAKLELREVDLVAAGFIDPGRGISMVDDVDADLKSDGENATSTGKIRALRLQLAPKGSPSQEPVDIDYSISQNLSTREVKISDIAIHAGSAALHITGTFKMSPAPSALNLHLSAPALPLEQVERLLPVVGVRLPGGASFQGGTLSANIQLTGPATSATMTGPIDVENTRLAGFDLGSRIEGLDHPAGTSTGTDVRVLKANLNSSPEGTHLKAIYAELPQIGTVSGEGTVAASGDLDLRLLAKLNNTNAQAGKLPSVSGRTIPLLITGTTASPSIRANASATAR